jgi:hypothetical protein
MKYVITDNNTIALGSGTYHRDLANALNGKVVSAGHCEIVNGKFRVFDGSAGFNMEAKEEDANILNQLFGL